MGALFLGVIKNALPVVNVSPFWQLAISGTAIIVAVAFNARAERTQGPGHPQVGGARRMTHVTDAPRVDPRPAAELGAPASLKSWEALLLAVAVAIFVVNSLASPYFLSPWNLSDATFNFTEKAMIAFPMALLIIAGEIDLSVAAIIALASTAMGYAVQLGVGTPGLVADRPRRRARSAAPSTACSSPASACPRSSSPSAP